MKKKKSNGHKSIKRRIISAVRKSQRFVLRLMSLVLMVIIPVGAVFGAFYYFKMTNWKSIETQNNIEYENEICKIPETMLVETDSTGQHIANEDDSVKIISDIAKQYGITDIEDSLSACKRETTDNGLCYLFEQVYQGIPVFGRKVEVRVDATGQVKNINNNYASLNNVNVNEKITENDARETVQNYYKNSIEIYNKGKAIYSLYGNEACLTWMFYVKNSDVAEKVFVDAVSGKILETITDVYTSDVGRYEEEDSVPNVVKNQDGSYSLIDEDRNIWIYDSADGLTSYAMQDDAGKYYFQDIDSDEEKWYDRPIQENLKNEVTLEYQEDSNSWKIMDKDGNIVGNNAHLVIYTQSVSEPLNVISNNSNVWENKEAVKAMSITGRAYDFFQDVLGRKGYDGNNGRVCVIINDTWDSGNNCYSHLGNGKPPTVIAYGKNFQFEVDTVGHEYMHSVERATSGMIYKNETGALMEAYSDVFGELFEDWLEDGVLNDGCDWQTGSRNLIMPTKSKIKYCYYERNGVECPVFNANKKHIAGSKLKKPGKLSKGCCTIEIPYPESYKDKNYWTGSADNGGVHVNSVIISHACYLMTHPEKMQGLTNEELAKLLYETLYDLKPDCNFRSFATEVYMNAIKMGLDDEKKEVIEKAFIEVGISFDKPLIVKLDDDVSFRNDQNKDYDEEEKTATESGTDAYEAYQNAVKHLTDAGSWSESLSAVVDMNMVSADERQKSRAKIYLDYDGNIRDYDPNNLSALKVSASANIRVGGQETVFTADYENGMVHYQYTQPTSYSADAELDPVYFQFSQLTSDMMQNVSMTGNIISFTVSGDQMTALGSEMINMINGAEDLKYEDCDVDIILNEESGQIDRLKMKFNASMIYQGYTTDAAYDVDYQFIA